MTEYQVLIRDFSQRTLENLDHVLAQARAGTDGVYEVTQLWNSMLGLIVLPRERDLGRIPKTPMAQLYSVGWPRLTVEGREPTTLHDLVKSLRNAVAHFNVTFEAGADREITSVLVWTEATGREGLGLRKGELLWKGRLAISEMEGLARRVVDTYLVQYRRRQAS